MGTEGGCEKIFVSIRLRPLNEKERARYDVSEWECVNDNTILYRNNLSVSERSMYPTGYTFDRVFSFDCSTRQVYNEGAKDVALSVVGGINASIFAYGQTSSGKTYTMSGITEYTVADIYDYLKKHVEREFVMKFSAMEIYNESVRDLLSTDSTPLRLLDDPERGTIVEKLTEETLRDWAHFRQLLTICEDQRQIGETSLNEASSRSHQILRLTIESSSREFNGNDKASALSATVNFIDLAGSERASQTLSAGTRLKEGCHINRSLLSLGTVIRKLSKGRNGHIPYRDSKLTRILQSSLGGNARTAIICTLSPARSHVEQSRNTLLFASCAKEVATNAQVNVVMSDKALVKKLQRELARLESELRCGDTPTDTLDSSALIIEKDREIEKLKKELSEITLQRDAAQSQVKDLLRAAEEDRLSESVDLDQYYPKLRVRSSWDFENQAPRELVLPHSNRPESSVRSFDTSRNSDEQSSNSDENFYQIPDSDGNSLCSNSSYTHVSVRIPDYVEIDINREEAKDNSDDNLEDLCKEVRCIEDPNASDCRSNRFLDSFVPSPEEKPAFSEFTPEKSIVSENDDLGSFHLKKPVFQISSPEKPFQWLFDKEMSGSACFKLTRSRSCRARLTSSLYAQWFDREETEQSTPPLILDQTFTGNGFPKKVHVLNYGADSQCLTRNDSRESDLKGNLSRNDSHEKLSRNSSQETSSKSGDPVSPRSDSQEKLSRSSSRENLSRIGSPEKQSKRFSHEKLSRNSSQEMLSTSGSQENLSRLDSPEMPSKRFSHEKLSRNSSQEILSTSGSPEKLSRSGSRENLSRIDSQEMASKRFSQEKFVHSDFEEILHRNGSQEKLSTNYSPESFSRSGSTKTLSRNLSQVSSRSHAIDDELKEKDITSLDEDENGHFTNSAHMIKEPVNFPCENPPSDSEVPKTEDDLSAVCTKNVKDVGLDPIDQSDSEIPSPSPMWASEFKKLQREIIELWHACNVSIVHRTYFFLLFRGDPTDAIYMEVEHRRLSFIKDTFSRGNHTIEDGRTLTYTTSERALYRERLMLSKQIQKKLSKHERQNMFLKWGIGLNTKNRRLQLAHLLWAHTKDMDRITDSAALVVKLVSSGEPEQASKEMFGLRFTPRRTNTKYYGLTQGVLSIL